jgi:hypothetical protein
MDMARFLQQFAVRALVVLVATILVLIVSAILLPPKGSNAMPRDDGAMTPATTPR